MGLRRGDNTMAAVVSRAIICREGGGRSAHMPTLVYFPPLPKKTTTRKRDSRQRSELGLIATEASLTTGHDEGKDDKTTSAANERGES